MQTLTLKSADYSGRIKGMVLLVFSLLIFLYLQVTPTFSLQESFIISYQVYLLLRFINNFGYTIGYFDFLLFYSALDTLIMPLVGYKIYNIDNELARLWGWYMRVPEDAYYEFLIPANLALFFGLNFFTKTINSLEIKELVFRLPEAARDKGKVGIVLSLIGFLATFIENYAIGSYVFHLLSMLKYVGPLYIYYSELPFRKKILLISLGAFAIQAILAGIFGEFFMYLILTFLVLSIKMRLSFIPKLLTFIIGIFLIGVLQSVKGTYRGITWRGISYHGLSTSNSSNIEIFTVLILDKLQNPGKLFEEKASFALYMRMNQGYLISRAMDYVPRVEPYAEGETIGRSVAAILVPRFLWPDKPEAGGYENLSRFLGIKKKLNYSMNIGPYGEAYGNFGPQYGVVFILCYGLFLSLLFKIFLDNCQKRPTLLLWAPLLFFYTLTVETDIMSTLNSFVKGAVFVGILFLIAKRLFRVSL
jgi:hypothetical protein